MLGQPLLRFRHCWAVNNVGSDLTAAPYCDTTVLRSNVQVRQLALEHTGHDACDGVRFS